jgi:hypothetical protein
MSLAQPPALQPFSRTSIHATIVMNRLINGHEFVAGNHEQKGNVTPCKLGNYRSRPIGTAIVLLRYGMPVDSNETRSGVDIPRNQLQLLVQQRELLDKQVPCVFPVLPKKSRQGQLVLEH